VLGLIGICSVCAHGANGIATFIGSPMKVAAFMYLYIWIVQSALRFDSS